MATAEPKIITIPDYVPPEFLNETLEEIHARMLASLPPDIDLSPAQTLWDFTRPTAIEKARTMQYQLNEVIKMMFPQWATGRWLDYHAQGRGLFRLPSVSSTGKIQITGRAGTAIPQGYIFTTVGTKDADSIFFETTEAATIPEGGVAMIPVGCVTPGVIGNVAENTIILMFEPLSGITAVTNPDRMTGGANEESDESLRSRVLSANNENSYIGNISDYRRWAHEIPGIGNVLVQDAWDGPGTVRLLLTDEQGIPASEALLLAVFTHIAAPDNPPDRLMPVSVELTTAAASALPITYAATIELDPTGDLADIITAFTEALHEVYTEAVNEGVLKYNMIGATLATTPGVFDYHDLTVNGGTVNIRIPADAFPTTDEVNFS